MRVHLVRLAPLCAGLGTSLPAGRAVARCVSSPPASSQLYAAASVSSLRSSVRSLHTSPRHLARPKDHFPGRGQAHETTAEMLDRLTAEARRRGAMDDASREYAGPFPLGVGPSGRNKTWAAWRDLGIGGKLRRMTVQSGNLLIIIAGAGLFFVLVIALSTELFAKNSPSVLYSECIDMIRDSDALDPFLLPPMSFTHSPHSSAPTRGTAPIQHRVVRHPTSGRDHLIITFWVHGRGKDEPEPLGWAKGWLATAEGYFRKAGSFLGFVANPDGPETPATVAERQVADEEKIRAEVEREAAQAEANASTGFLGRLVQAFSLRPGGIVRTAAAKIPPPGTYKLAEVRADYVKNASGHYTMLALVADVPNARVNYPGRALIYWSPEADREGLIERR